MINRRGRSPADLPRRYRWAADEIVVLRQQTSQLRETQFLLLKDINHDRVRVRQLEMAIARHRVYSQSKLSVLVLALVRRCFRRGDGADERLWQEVGS